MAVRRNPRTPLRRSDLVTPSQRLQNIDGSGHVTPRRPSTTTTPRPLPAIRESLLDESQASDSTRFSSQEAAALYKQQEKLQASASRIEQILSDMQSSTSTFNDTPRSTRVPRELSAMVHDVYAKLEEDDDDSIREQHWDFSVKFDDINNKDFSRMLIKNVQPVVDKSDNGSNFDVVTIKRAVRTYFKSKKGQHARKEKGQHLTSAANSRRRQRRHNKANARLKALHNSTTIEEQAKQKYQEVLKAEFMSSDESVRQDSDGSVSSGSDRDERHPPVKKKRLIKHKLPWRSREMQAVVESLDRKIERRRTARSKAMCLEVEVSGESTRPKPDGLPDWAVELFS